MILPLPRTPILSDVFAVCVHVTSFPVLLGCSCFWRSLHDVTSLWWLLWRRTLEQGDNRELDGLAAQVSITAGCCETNTRHSWIHANQAYSMSSRWWDRGGGANSTHASSWWRINVWWTIAAMQAENAKKLYRMTRLLFDIRFCEEGVAVVCARDLTVDDNID